MNALLPSIPATNPDFLWSFVGSLYLMRLSLKERRTRGPVQSRVQEIGAIDGCPMRLPRVKTSVLPAVSAPILRVLCEGWESRPEPGRRFQAGEFILPDRVLFRSKRLMTGVLHPMRR
jgi:hypothetical protein